MPESYRPHVRKDDEAPHTSSQSIATNVGEADADVQSVLDQKDGAIFTIRPQQTLQEAVNLLRDHRIGALLVTDASGTLVGIVSERDIVRNLAVTPGSTLGRRVDEVMTKEVQTCAPGDALTSVLEAMTEGRFRHLPVVDDSGLVGLITIGDVVHYRLTQLEYEALQIKQLIVG